MEKAGSAYLVVTYIDNHTGRTRFYYEGKHDVADCALRLSFRASFKELGIPLWFSSEEAARQYIQRAAESGSRKEFTLIQEFTYHHNRYIKNEAKIIFSCISETWPILAEGETERSPGVWAHVRSIFVCDRTAADDYVRRFNLDAEAAHGADCGE